ncbi:preprotein translocase subunit SecG [Patescibacteria group bacterium]|nr:preprotein translocase subunit SecG [Patescibacteria group bacterium]
MVTTLHSIQIIVAIVLVALILLQRPSNDASSMPVGGDSSSFSHTKRGAERFFFVLTIVLAVVFAAVSLTVVVLAQ